MKQMRIIIAATLVSGLASAALAGGPTQVLPEPEIIAPVAAAAPMRPAWEGFYAGGSLGYGFGGDDRVGYRDATSGSWIGSGDKLEGTGGLFGLHLGYRWQYGPWVFGPELGYQKAKVSDESAGTASGAPVTLSSEVTSLLALRLKSGYLLRPDMMIYGQAGVVRADVEYRLNGSDAGDYTANGYTLGLGVEKQINANWSVFGEYEYVELGKDKRVFGAVSSEATPAFQTVKIGVNYQF